MRAPLVTGASLAAALVGTVGFPAVSRAADTITRETAVIQEPVYERNESRPNKRLLRAGLVTWGVAYIPAVVVAATSERRGDDRLYYPVVGPWWDLADRRSCDFASGCRNETLNKVLLVTDGVFQGIGALTFVGGLIFPDTTRASEVSRARRPLLGNRALHVAPVSLGRGGYGLAMRGSF